MNIEGFSIDMRKAYRLAGMRYKAWPKSRKRIRKIKRQRSREFWKDLNESIKNPRGIVSIRSEIECGLPMTITEFEDGSSNVEICMGTSLGESCALSRLLQEESK